MRALPTNWQSALVTISSITFDCLQPLKIHSNLSTQITFHYISTILNGSYYLRDLLFRQFFGTNVRVNTRLL